MSEKKEEAVYSNPNGMPMAQGKNLHMDLGPGDISNRIVTVGTASRAEKIASYFDNADKPEADGGPKRIQSGRGFLTITGTFEGIPCSVVAIGMGPSMMDFFVRETRAVVEGPIVACRFGTCGGITSEALVGSVVVASEGSAYVTRNPDAFTYRYNSTDSTEAKDAPGDKYNMYEICPSDPTLSAMVKSNHEEILVYDIELNNDSQMGNDTSRWVAEGANVTAESFYSSQGRIDPQFDDSNEDLIEQITSKYPNARTMEMETFLLFHLAKSCKVPIYASAAAIVVANRDNNSTVDSSKLERVEALGGKAVLQAVCRMPMP